MPAYASTLSNNVRNDVIIKRLKLRAQTRWQQLIYPRLEQVQWPELGPNEYLFIHRLSLSVRDTELETSLSGLVAQLAGQAADGQRPEVKTAPVVRFPSYTRLLATLTEDLHFQRAKGRWFWRDWHHLQALPTAEAITELWANEPLHLAELCARLSTNGHLVAIWQQFSPTQFQRISRALAHGAGFTPPPFKSEPKPAAKKPNIDMPELKPPRRFLQRWEKVLATTNADHPSRQLAALLTLLEWRPDILVSEFAAESLQAVGDRLSQRSAISTARLSATKTATEATPASNAGGGKSAAGVHPDLAVTAAGALNAASDRISARNTDEKNPAGSDSLATAPLAHLDGDEFSTQFSTKNGGLFYLLNFLNQHQTLELIDDAGGFAALSGGWGWLYRLGVSLGLEADSSLAQFIATQLGLDAPDALADLPPLPNKDAFLTLFQQRYQRLQPWPSRLLSRPARVSATATHLDLYFRLQSVDLDIRLAGLDIDPGWLSWLGRVVHFHFLENPFVARSSPQ